ncbi:MAG: hypothetical protein ABWX58_06910 [Psychrobacillus psychrotolerans]
MIIGRYRSMFLVGGSIMEHHRLILVDHRSIRQILSVFDRLAIFYI